MEILGFLDCENAIVAQPGINIRHKSVTTVSFWNNYILDIGVSTHCRTTYCNHSQPRATIVQTQRHGRDVLVNLAISTLFMKLYHLDGKLLSIICMCQRCHSVVLSGQQLYLHGRQLPFGEEYKSFL